MADIDVNQIMVQMRAMAAAAQTVNTAPRWPPRRALILRPCSRALSIKSTPPRASARDGRGVRQR